MHLRHAAQRVGVLHLVAALGVRRADLESASSARRWAAAATWPGCGRASISAGSKADAVPSMASRLMAPMTSAETASRRASSSARAAERGHQLRAVQQRQALLGLEGQRLQPAVLEGLRAPSPVRPGRPRPRPRRSPPAPGGRAAPGRPMRRRCRATAPPDAPGGSACRSAAPPPRGARRTAPPPGRWPAAAAWPAPPRRGVARPRRRRATAPGCAAARRSGRARSARRPGRRSRW